MPATSVASKDLYLPPRVISPCPYGCSTPVAVLPIHQPLSF